MHATDIVGYMFRTEVICPRCINHAVASRPEYDGWRLADSRLMSAEEDLDEIAASFGIDRQNEETFDSGEFPKVIFASQVEDNEFCEHCGDDLI